LRIDGGDDDAERLRRARESQGNVSKGDRQGPVGPTRPVRVPDEVLSPEERRLLAVIKQEMRSILDEEDSPGPPAPLKRPEGASDEELGQAVAEHLYEEWLEEKGLAREDET
jgi:hypothetical protein